MKDNVEMVYMWRELNDEWYRIQTNSPYIIGKLNRRSKKKNKIRLVGKTVKSSSQYWLIYRVQYNKPSTAKQSFKRLTNCKDKFTENNGVFCAQVVYKMKAKKGDEI